ncbi:hypothetical protein C5B42_01495 [Candidatus Cerribacteria bacterium 'Amazon FNV 2010 28 9']|uniref:Probable endonuclease 4 n=1 Tax=Candidatus Cerribacteria bacterium 'Amazon FNV 2010 28 9' TaxID=2081795 RepID=A0A317JTI0_9BACT|nr:MAG: hypothetical protein C5B42_01495 [Candidatus Cerribacteria bacterium 'Amazon FNV 2010 28 9']
MFIGGHVSAAGGISLAYGRAKEIGGNAVQIFSASPRVWTRKDIAQSEIDRCLQFQKELGITKTVIHAIYLVNLASDNKELVEKSRNCIEFDLRVDAALHGSGVVVHVGSHQGKGFEAVFDQLVHEIKIILSNTPENSTFLIENSAGQNGKIASDLSEIRRLIDAVGSPRLGWCLDTCHAFCAGYELENSLNSPLSHQPPLTPPSEGGESKNVIEEIDRLQLWDTLKVVHVNDSRDSFDSGRDRHENIGEGSIGDDVFRSFFSHEKIRTLPLIIEVPGIDHKSGPDKENIERVKRLM